MSKRYDICQAQERGEKTYWNKIGTLWQNDDGKMSISFDALPIASLNREGKIETRAMCFEPKARDSGGGSREPSNGAPVGSDDIPF
jgi:hypothetical protein